MATTSDTGDDTVASHTLAYLRSIDRKVDFVMETMQRHTERLGRVERDISEPKRDVAGVKSDMALLENKIITAQTDILGMRGDIVDMKGEIAKALVILHRLDPGPAK
ncbi:MAG TPA: hypothetical protein VH684_06895 [Xanthobacteraceae bacterium]|jgi:hypothetical protein